MKKILASLIIVGFTTTTINAQNPQRKMHRMHPGRQMMMHRHLTLSEEQKQKMKLLNEDFRKNLMDLRKKDDITVKEWKTRMADLHKKRRSDQQNLFTQEQKNRIEKMKIERKQMAEIDARARMEKMKIRLGLSNEQTEKLNAQRKDFMEKINTLRKNETLNTQRQREVIKALMEKRKETMKSILTDEQRKKMQEMKMHQPRQMKMRQPRPMNIHQQHKPGKLS